MSLPTAYLAPVSWYKALAALPSAAIEQHEHYVKQTARNRARILMPTGVQDLIVPVEAAPNHTPIRDIRISEHGHWRHHHWSALRTAYGKSPFFEYYADDFAPFYERRYDFLLDFNLRLHETVCQLIDLHVPLTLTEAYDAAAFTDFRDLPVDTTPYYQVFAERLGFSPDLSIIDLICNLGPESILYLNASKTL